MVENLKYYIALILFCFVLSTCSDDPDSGDILIEPPSKPVTIPSLQADSAFKYIEQQLSFGPRVPGTKAHRNTAEWLVTKFQEFGWKAEVQEFTAAHPVTSEKVQAINIIASYNSGEERRVLLGAHWDTRFVADMEEGDDPGPVPGADDGGSGVGVLLEIARVIGEKGIDKGVDIILFDMEDQGIDDGSSPESWALGAQYWSKNPHVPGYDADYGILLDMVGAKNATFGHESFSMQANAPLVRRIWDMAGKMGYGTYFINQSVGAVTDDHFYVIRDRGIPMINIINKSPQATRGFGDHWHTLQDDLDIIDKRTLKAVGQVVLATIYR